MQQVKLFKNVDTEIHELEQEINSWIQESGARIISVSGNLAAQSGGSGGPLNSFAGGDVLVIVLYEGTKKSV